MPTLRFGRVQVLDARDRDYLMVPPAAALGKAAARRWVLRWQGDQGKTSECVGYGWTHWLACEPVCSWVDPRGLYRFCQANDGLPDATPGTTVRAGAKVLAQLGAIGQYRWAWQAATVADQILATGPVVIGSDWLAGMDKPDQSHVIRATGKIRGGHCYVALGYDSETRLFEISNSWGPDWGDQGNAYLPYADLDTLLRSGGEACIGVENALAPPSAGRLKQLEPGRLYTSTKQGTRHGRQRRTTA